MSEEHERFRETLGAYLLGELDGEERRALRAHLETCPICQAEARELEPVVAGLAEAAPNNIEESPHPPAGLEERTFARIERARAEDQVGQRRRRRARQALLASAAALLVVVAGLALYPRFFMPTVPIEPVAFSETAPGIEAEASLISHTWGTETRMVASGLEDGQTYTVALLDEDGYQVPSGTFIGTSERPVECNLNAALLRPDVAALEVRGAGDELLLYADLPEQEAQVASSGGVLSWISPSTWGNEAQAEEPELARVPEVEGLRSEEAEEGLREAGFGTEIVREESRPEEDGKVLEQSPSGGEKLRLGVRVVLTVGEGVPGEAGEEPGRRPDPPRAADPEAPAPPRSSGEGAEAPPPPAGGGEAVPPSPTPNTEPLPAPAPPPEPYGEPTTVAPAPVPAPAEPAPLDEGQARDYYGGPADEQYPPPSYYDTQPEQPYPQENGGGPYGEDPGYTDRVPETDDGGPESGGEPPDPGYDGPENGGSDYEDPENGDGGYSGYEGSGY